MRTFHTVVLRVVIDILSSSEIVYRNFGKPHFTVKINPDVHCETTFLDDRDKLDKYSDLVLYLPLLYLDLFLHYSCQNTFSDLGHNIQKQGSVSSHCVEHHEVCLK